MADDVHRHSHPCAGCGSAAQNCTTPSTCKDGKCHIPASQARLCRACRLSGTIETTGEERRLMEIKWLMGEKREEGWKSLIRGEW